MVEPCSDKLNPPEPQPKWRTLLAGAAAGLIVDTTLYPVDTIKSRLQSKQGFLKAGGFKNLYRGLPPVLAGSVPNAAAFFITYETVKENLHQYKAFGPTGNAHVASHMLAASLSEVVSCIVRVPYEVVKMRSQTSEGKVSNMAIMRATIAREGMTGLYRGFLSTVIRDIPFSALQFPIWERLKSRHAKKYQRPATAFESAYYGSIAGAIAAFLTTPLDVAKTRIMLAEQSDTLASGRVLDALKAIHSEKGIAGLFAGFLPRVIWISVGAAIFLGSYEKSLKVLS